MSGPALSPETERRLNLLFRGAEERAAATTLLTTSCGNNLPFCAEHDAHQMERIRFAALKQSNGDFEALKKAVNLARLDWRDLLVAAGFAEDTEAHLGWEPGPGPKT